MAPRIPWKNLGNPLEISLIVREIQKFPMKKQTNKQKNRIYAIHQVLYPMTSCNHLLKDLSVWALTITRVDTLYTGTLNSLNYT